MPGQLSRTVGASHWEAGGNFTYHIVLGALFSWQFMLAVSGAQHALLAACAMSWRYLRHY